MNKLFTLLITFFIFLPTSIVVGQQPLFNLLNTQKTGIDFQNQIDESEELNVMAYEYFFNGGGVAVGDINNDGLEDILFTANMKPNKLYLNLGNLHFKDITKSLNKDLEGRKGAWKTGASMADINGDGLLDIYLCYAGKGDPELRRNQLFINQGNLKFTEKAKEFGLDSPCYSTQSAFLDYDNDGDLDMFLLNHNVKKYDNMQLAKLRNEIDENAGNRLFENKGNHFEDVTQKSGIHQYPLTFGLGIAIADLNQDGLSDIYVTNDYNEPDYLYLNQGNGTFREVTNTSLQHLSQFSMGVDIADFNNDGLPDILSLDMLPEDNKRQKLLQLQENYESFELMQQQGLQKQYMHNMLQLNIGNDANGIPKFSEIARLAGISNTDWSWCPLIADFDNDGQKDIFISNGYLRDYTNKDFLRYWGDYKVRKAIDREPMQLMDLVRAMPSTKISNYIFKNKGDFTFSNQQMAWGINTPTISNGAAYADLDNDGDLELIINNINEQAFIYQNMSRELMQDEHFLQLTLINKNTSKTVLGSKVYLYLQGKIQYQEVAPYRGYLSCESQRLHFGLGKTTSVDSLKIIWADHSIQWLKNLQIDKNQVIEQQSSIQAKTISTIKTIFQAEIPTINYQHDAFLENDFKRQPLMLFMYSATGPVMAKGDINKDGLEDLFLSGDKNKQAELWIQQKNGTFQHAQNPTIGDENTSAISAAIFFDANGDKLDDLYIAKGGYSLFEPNTASFQDEIYLNNGNGKLLLSTNALPDVSASSKAFVRPCDFDNDGDIDLFVGGRVIAGRYPETPKSYLLENNGKGIFNIKDAPFAQIGMLTDAQWSDFDHDGRKDLVLCGEFMSIKVYLNKPTGFIDKTAEYLPNADTGLWFSLAVVDVNGDGQQDIIGGNYGINSVLKVSKTQPATLHFADFDGNGSIDPIMNFFVQGRSYPFISRDELNDQIFPMRRRFALYQNYAEATINDIFTKDELAKSNTLMLNENRSICYLSNKKNTTLEANILPIEAQFSPISQILVKDFDQDGAFDLLLLGNKTDNRLKLGSMDANYGCFLKGKNNGQFEYIPQSQSGLSITGDVKSALEIKIGTQNHILIGAFNQALQWYQQ